MRPVLIVMTFAVVAAAVEGAPAQHLTLPVGARTHWVIDQTEEIVEYLIFDPTTVQDRIPPTLRFITVKQLADGDVGWAADYIAEHPSRGHWGISFFEIARMGTFKIDGRAPRWPENGAVALWCARVESADSTIDLGPGVPFLVLNFWVPDSMYAGYMRMKGHYATYGDVRLYRDSERRWCGSVKIKWLSVVARCKPVGAVTGGVGSAGMQALFPPLSSGVNDVVRVAFAGHREQQCEEDSSWIVRGTHPLVYAVALGTSIYEFGYGLVGGAYQK